MKPTQSLRENIENLGFTLLGAINIARENKSINPELPKKPKSVVLIGNAGAAFWPRFTSSLHYKAKNSENPLDDWTRTQLDSLAKEYSAQVSYPFAGPPYEPFSAWAREILGIESSPLGILIHPRFGLWFALRAAFFGDRLLTEAELANLNTSSACAPTPCTTCTEKPCLQACPVSAFASGRFAADSCADFVAKNKEKACYTNGCQARIACPVGKKYQYSANQSQFHLDSFLKNLARDDSGR